MKTIVPFIVVILSAFGCRSNRQYAKVHPDSVVIRIAEIEIDSAYTEEYFAILMKEAEASVRLEPGVISIFPMYRKENPSEIKILEIYANKAAYQSHLQTPHFKHYKTSTLNMVKSLNLIDMKALDPGKMARIFKPKKLNRVFFHDWAVNPSFAGVPPSVTPND